VFLVLTSIVGIWKDMSYGTLSLAVAWNTTNAIILGAFIVVAFREARRLKREAQPAPASAEPAPAPASAKPAPESAKPAPASAKPAPASDAADATEPSSVEITGSNA